MLPPLPALRLVPAHDLGPLALISFPAEGPDAVEPGQAVTAKHLLHLFSLWAVLGVAVGLFLSLMAPFPLGGRALTVMSGSMSPTVDTGDIVVTRRVSASEAKIGDVVTFQDPKGSGKLISHRVRRIQSVGGQIRFTTKGDANTAVERWTVAPDGKIGRAQYRLPKLGYLAAWVSSRPGRILLIVVPALLLCVLELRRIWSPDTGATGSV